MLVRGECPTASSDDAGDDARPGIDRAGLAGEAIPNVEHDLTLALSTPSRPDQLCPRLGNSREFPVVAIRARDPRFRFRAAATTSSSPVGAADGGRSCRRFVRATASSVLVRACSGVLIVGVSVAVVVASDG